MLRNPDDAEDMVQEAFVRLYRALPRYEERHEAHTVEDDDVLARVPSLDMPDTQFDHEWGDDVRRALAEVPDYNREIFLLHYIEGFAYDEIERMTGIKQSALKMRVKRASDMLRTHLAERYG